MREIAEQALAHGLRLHHHAAIDLCQEYLHRSVQRLTGLGRSAGAENLPRDDTDARSDDVALALAQIAPQLSAVLDDAFARRDHIREPRYEVALFGREHELEQGADHGRGGAV